MPPPEPFLPSAYSMLKIPLTVVFPGLLGSLVVVEMELVQVTIVLVLAVVVVADGNAEGALRNSLSSCAGSLGNNRLSIPGTSCAENVEEDKAMTISRAPVLEVIQALQQF